MSSLESDIATAKRIAREIADEANKCCYRSDGYKEEIEQFACRRILNAIMEARQ